MCEHTHADMRAMSPATPFLYNDKSKFKKKNEKYEKMLKAGLVGRSFLRGVCRMNLYICINKYFKSGESVE